MPGLFTMYEPIAYQVVMLCFSPTSLANDIRLLRLTYRPFCFKFVKQCTHLSQ
jgi:hypothetical protein